MRVVLGSLVVAAVAIAVICPSMSNASAGLIRGPIGVLVEPLTLPEGDGVAKLLLTCGPVGRRLGDSITVSISTTGGLVYYGPNDYTLAFPPPFHYTDTLTVLVPPDTITTMKVLVTCGTTKDSTIETLLSLGGVAEYNHGLPPPREYLPGGGHTPWQPPQPQGYIERDTLTVEQLQVHYGYVVMFRDSEERRKVENLIGAIPDSSVCKKAKNTMLLSLPLKDFFRLLELGITIVDTSSVPLRVRDSLGIPRIDHAKDGLIEESYLAPESFDGISLDYVDGMTTPGILPTGREITFLIRNHNTVRCAPPASG